VRRAERRSHSIPVAMTELSALLLRKGSHLFDHACKKRGGGRGGCSDFYGKPLSYSIKCGVRDVVELRAKRHCDTCESVQSLTMDPSSSAPCPSARHMSTIRKFDGRQATLFSSLVSSLLRSQSEGAEWSRKASRAAQHHGALARILLFPIGLSHRARNFPEHDVGAFRLAWWASEINGKKRLAKQVGSASLGSGVWLQACGRAEQGNPGRRRGRPTRKKVGVGEMARAEAERLLMWQTANQPKASNLWAFDELSEMGPEGGPANPTVNT
jgi:hypothetical protein